MKITKKTTQLFLRFSSQADVDLIITQVKAFLQNTTLLSIREQKSGNFYLASFCTLFFLVKSSLTLP